MAGDNLLVVEADSKLPQSWESSLVLIAAADRDSSPSWQSVMVNQLRKLDYGGVVFLAPLFGDEGAFKALKWAAVVSNLADVCVCQLDVSAIQPAHSLLWLLWPEVASTRKVVVQLDTRDAELLEGFSVPAMNQVRLVSSSGAAAKQALELTRTRGYRSGQERKVPIDIWQTAEFQRWYRAQRGAGNRLEDVRPVWAFPSRASGSESLWYWAMHVVVHIASEGRRKANEAIISRPDIAATVLYSAGETLREMQVVLVREFRSPASGADGYVWELPSGSGDASENMSMTAARECHEETGLRISPDRLVYHGVRQLMTTMSCHQAHLFSTVLSTHELDQLAAEATIPHGAYPNERTYVEVLSFSDIMKRGLLDWSMLGMVYEALLTAATHDQRSV